MRAVHAPIVAATALLVAVPGLLAAPATDAEEATTGESTAKTAVVFESTVTIGVSGMTDESGAAKVQESLGKLDGVSSAEVSHEKGEAKVTFDPRAAKMEGLHKAIEEAGFGVVARNTAPAHEHPAKEEKPSETAGPS